MANADESTRSINELLDELQESSEATVSRGVINSLAAQIIAEAHEMIRTGSDDIRIFCTQQIPRSHMYHTTGGYVLRYVAPTSERAGAALLFGGVHAPYHRLDETAFYLVSLRHGDHTGWAKQISRLDLANPADLRLIWDVISTA